MTTTETKTGFFRPKEFSYLEYGHAYWLILDWRDGTAIPRRFPTKEAAQNVADLLNEGKRGICPACKGTGRKPVPEESRQWIRWEPRWEHWFSAGYDPETDTFPCSNCGGQTMSCRGSGIVNLRPDGTPCLHEYEQGPHDRPRSCYHHSVCKHGCGFEYAIDSGD